MSSIKLISVDISGDKELIDTLNNYTEAITSASGSRKSRQVVQKWVEQTNAAILTKLSAVKASKADQNNRITLSPTSSLLDSLYREAYNKSTTPMVSNQISKTYLTDLADNNLDDLVFSRKDPTLFNKLYDSASVIVFNTKSEGIDKLNIVKVPKTAFTSENFDIYSQGSAVIVQAKSAYIAQLTSLSSSISIKQATEVFGQPIRQKISGGNKTFLVDVLPVSAVKSLSTTSIISTSSSTVVELPKEFDFSNKQKFISGLQLSYLVQRRLGDSMGRVGAPNPPDLKYRSGRFANSARVFPDYRNRIVRYMYNPLYDANVKYGYNPSSQVQTATLEVLQRLFAQQFKVIRA